MASVVKQRKLAIMRGNKLGKIKAANAIGRPLDEGDMDGLAQELVDSTVESFEKALNDVSPAEKEMASSISDVFAEFIAGFREGVQAELQVIKKEYASTGSVLKGADDKQFDLLTSIDKGIKLLAEAAKKKDKVVTQVVPGDEQDTPERLKQEVEAEKQPERKFLSVPSARDDKEESHLFLGRMRGDVDWSKRASAPTFAKQAAYAVVGGFTGLMGGGEYAERKIEELQKRDNFVETERELRALKDPEGFGKLSKREQTKQLTSAYKEMQGVEKELTGVEESAEKLRQRGYSEEDVESTLGYTAKRKPLVEKLRTLDTSRTAHQGFDNVTPIASTAPYGMPMMDANVLQPGGGIDLSAAEESQFESSRGYSDQITELRQHTTTLIEIRDILTDTLKLAKDREQTPAEQEGGGVSSLLEAGAGVATMSKGAGALKSMKGMAKLPVLGTAITAGIGLYEGYQSWGAAEDTAKSKESDLQALEAQGLISKDEAAAKRKAIAAEETEYKGGAVGKGAGIIGGTLAGAKAGAMLGTFFGPVGTAIGGVAGGAIGGIAGSSVGQNIGGAIGKGAAAVGSWFSGDEVEKSNQLSVDSAKDAKEVVPQRSSLESQTLREKALTDDSAAASTPNITVQAPPATVIKSGDDTKVVSQPFSTRIRVQEPSLSDYLRSRYAAA